NWLIADVTQDNDVAAMIETVIARHQRLDIAFNNAGILGPPAPIADIDSDTWDSVLNTKLTGVCRSMKYESRIMHLTGCVENMTARDITIVLNQTNMLSFLANPLPLLP